MAYLSVTGEVLDQVPAVAADGQQLDGAILPRRNGASHGL